MCCRTACSIPSKLVSDSPGVYCGRESQIFPQHKFSAAQLLQESSSCPELNALILPLLLPNSPIPHVFFKLGCFRRRFAFRSSEEMHDLVIRLFINRYEFGLLI